MARRKLSTGRISNGETTDPARAETEIETPPVSITTLPTLPERSPYSRVEQQPEDALPQSEFLFFLFDVVKFVFKTNDFLFRVIMPKKTFT